MGLSIYPYFKRKCSPFNIKLPLFFSSQCFCTGTCTCAAVLPVSPSSSVGSDYLNRRRWSQESNFSQKGHLASNLKLPQQEGASSPLGISPSLSRKQSKSSWSQGGDSVQEKGDDICIVVTDADPRSNPWGSCEKERKGAPWMANFPAIIAQESKERSSPRKRPSSPGLKN